MSAEDRARAEIATLGQLLDSYGGDSGRWPAGAVRRFGPLLARDARARAMLAEALALDAVLWQAPTAGVGRQRRLRDRIVGAAASDLARNADGNVVDLAAARRAGGRPPVIGRRADWQAAGLLAASLLLGVIGGATGMTGTALDEMASLAGLASESDTLTATLGQAVLSSPDEETL